MLHVLIACICTTLDIACAALYQEPVLYSLFCLAIYRTLRGAYIGEQIIYIFLSSIESFLYLQRPEPMPILLIVVGVLAPRMKRYGSSLHALTYIVVGCALTLYLYGIEPFFINSHTLYTAGKIGANLLLTFCI